MNSRSNESLWHHVESHNDQLRLARQLRCEYRATGRLREHQIQFAHSDIPLKIGVLGKLSALRTPVITDGSGSWEKKLAACLAPFAPQPHAAEAPWQKTAWSLTDIPALWQYAGDVAPYWSLAVVVSQHPLDASVSLGIYRVQVQSSETATINVLPGSALARHLMVAADGGKPLPVIIVLGADVPVLLAAATPLPESLSKLAFAGWADGAPIHVCSSPVNSLPVPRCGSILVEGEIALDERAMEGPFGNHTGGYTVPALRPLFRLRQIYAEAHPHVSGTLVGRPPTENLLFAQAWETLLTPIFRASFAGFLGWSMVPEGVFHGVSVVQVDETAWEGRDDFLRRLATVPWFKRAKLLILVSDEPQVTHDAQQLLALCSRADWSRSLLAWENRWVFDLRQSMGERLAQSKKPIVYGESDWKTRDSRWWLWKIINHGLAAERLRVRNGRLIINARPPQGWENIEG